MTRKGHFPRPGETDPYEVQGGVVILLETDSADSNIYQIYGRPLCGQTRGHRWEELRPNMESGCKGRRTEGRVEPSIDAIAGICSHYS